MRLNLHSYHETIPFNYVNEIFRTVSRDIVIASEKDHIESFNELVDFLIYNLKGKSFNKSISAFSKSVTQFIYIFPNLSSEYKKVFIERIFSSLITTISISNDAENVDEKYIKLSYLSLINIFKLILQEDDYDLFNTGIQQFKDNIFRIENKADRGNFFLYFVTTLLSWIYFLKKYKSISYEKYDINYLEHSLESISYKFDFIFINHFFELFAKIETENLWAVSEWAVKDPPKNRAYIALSPHDWLPYSLTIILLKFEHLLSPNSNLSKITLDPRFRFMHDNMEKILNDITLENNEYKNLIFNDITQVGLDEELNFKKEKILNVFSYLKKEVEIDYYRKIRGIPLSTEKIDEFRTNVGKLWEENTVVLSILKGLDNVEYVPNNEDVKGYGFFQRLLKMKFTFIDGELYQNVFGLSSFGSQLARSIDNDFFNKFNNERAISTDKIKETVLDFIDKTATKTNIVIFANWRNADKLEDITYEHNRKKPLFNKKFYGIPVVHQFSKFKDSILVIDFSLIRALIYTSDNPNWYKRQLLIEITESQKDDITADVIKEWNEKDSYSYNEDEVDILESNNVNAKILLKYEFIIPNKTRYIILE